MPSAMLTKRPCTSTSMQPFRFLNYRFILYTDLLTDGKLRSDLLQETDYSDGKASARLINDWVEKITQSKIKDLIKPDMLGPLTRLVLVNAIYFKGDWASKFDVKKTTDEVGPHS